MRIGQVASRAGVPVTMVRYYERAGLLPPAPRTPSGHREYGIDTVARLRFIRSARDAGLGLDEIRALLAWDDLARPRLERTVARLSARLEAPRSERGASTVL